MYIGEELQKRMDLLGLTTDEVANNAFMEKEDVDVIVQNKIALEDIDEFDMELICSVIHCKPEFFTDANVREEDLLLASMNRDFDNEKSMKVKAKLQDFISDFAFVMDVSQEYSVGK